MERNLEHELEAELASELEGESEFAHESHELESETEGELESESELEAEGELESESEAEAESEAGEQFLGNILGGLLGEGESEAESELEAELEAESESESEGELEQGEQFLGNILGGLLGEGEMEHEQGEQFFGRAFRNIGRLVQRAAPMLKNVARVAAPIVGKAVGGAFLGPAGAQLGGRLAQLAAQQLREQEMGGAHELESEFELESGEGELGEHEVSHELAEHEAEAEAMAHFAAFSESEHESEALAGAAVTVTLSPRDRRALRALVPHMVRGAAILTRILRMRRSTRPFVRVVPTVVRRTVRTLRRGAMAGRPITRQRAARVMARQTRRVLSSPRYCRGVLRRNIRATRAVARPRRFISSGIRARRGRSI